MRYSSKLFVLAVLAAAGLTPAAPAQTGEPTALEVFPPEINLLSARGKQVFVVQAAYPDGITCDVSAKVKASLEDSSLAKIEKNLVTPLADGSTTLTVEFAG